MERFTGKALKPRPHIAVLFYDAIGDFVVATPLLRGLREKYPGCVLDYYGGERTRELEQASRLVDARCSVFGPGASLATVTKFAAERIGVAGGYDLVVNCDDHPTLAVLANALQPRYVVGACFDAELRGLLPAGPEKVDALAHEFWAAPDLLDRYGDVLASQYIGEILCRLARIETDFARTEVPVAPPPVPVPAVLISAGGKRQAKLWPAYHWLNFLERCEAAGLEVGLLGDRPESQRERYHSGDDEDYLLARVPLVDLRGRLTLPQVAGALAKARACITVDNGIMHLAGAVGVPTLALFGASPWRVWAPRSPNLQVVLGDEPCSMCEDNRFRNADCLRERQVCMLSIAPEHVFSRLQAILNTVQ